VGIDPASNLADVARQGGARSICGPFTQGTAHEAVLAAGGGADLIVARHVFCHIDDWDEFMRALDVVAGTYAAVAIEVPYVADLLNNTEFDTIYHEHLSYLSLRALSALVDRSAFKLCSVRRFPIHGGSIVITLQRKGEMEKGLADMLQAEDITEATWRSFSDRVEANTAELKNFLRGAKASGFKACGFGASAKSTVWINACKFTKDDIAFICDSTRGKWHCFSPGTDIPITDEGALLRELPNSAVLFAWNFKDEITSKNARWIEKGGRFVVPVPKLEIAP
jgi:novobiocin biosynthesis protein NovU/D-mycarose 3-C-methyltransferase